MNLEKFTLTGEQWDELDARECPACGAQNGDAIRLYNMLEDGEGESLLGGFRGAPSCIVVVGSTEHVLYHGTGCWDSMFGDECAACLRTICTDLESPALAEVYTHIDWSLVDTD